MGILLNGNKPSKIIYNGAETSLYYNGSKIWPEEAPYDPYNPLNLPANTVRVRTNDGNAPTKGTNTSYETATLVAGTSDVYDVYKSGTDFINFLMNSANVVEVLGANTTGITNMYDMFYKCSSLTSVLLFDTSSVTNMEAMFYGCTSLTSVPSFDTSSVINIRYMFYRCTSLTSVPSFDTSSVEDMTRMFSNCTSLISVPLFVTSSVTTMEEMFYICQSLTSVPLFDTSSVTNMKKMFYTCYNVASGALALYRQASSQTKPPTYYAQAFYRCGRDTTTGAAELSQIPTAWK